jgi:iron complex outermembrane receptor protein
VQETDGLLFGFVNADPRITQSSHSIYGRHETLFEPQRLKAFAGVRRTTADRLSLGNPPGEFNSGETSWELGASKKLGQSSEIFAKVGTSFRLPNANEYTCYVQFCPGGASKLLAQTSKDADLGWRQKTTWGEWTARYYRNDLRREIGFDPMMGNVNFDPTRREGLELDASAQLSRALNGGLQFAERRAVFRRGAYEGKTVPLVPHRTLTARLTYRQSPTQQWVLSSQLVSSQRIGDDFDNVSTTRIPGYGILNLRYSQSIGAWTWAISGKNLLDKQYYNYRTYVNETYRSIYPEAGRTFLVSAERRF